jgi:putative DNA primase/helicase
VDAVFGARLERMAAVRVLAIRAVRMIAATTCRCGSELSHDGFCLDCGWLSTACKCAARIAPIEISGNGHRDGVVGHDGVGGTIKMADVQPVKIDWLWEDRIPRGMVTVFTGPPKVGKSTILYDLAARLSREGQHVLVITAEDHLAAVVRPRLEAAGADLNFVDAVTDPITLPDDVARIRGWIEHFGSVLVMLDPLVAFIGDAVNTHRDHHVRRVLAPLADLAETTGVAVVVVIHSNKSVGSDPLFRVSGSIGFSGAGRSIVVAADDPQDDSRKIFGVAGTNLAEIAPPLAYRIVGVEFDSGIKTSRIEWLGEAPEVDVRELLVQRDPEERTVREEAIAFLRTSGAMESAQPVKELEKEAKARGISYSTLQRARRALRLPVSLSEFGGPRYWGPSPVTHSGHHHLDHTDQTGPDLQEQGSQTPSLVNDQGLGRQHEQEGDR